MPRSFRSRLRALFLFLPVLLLTSCSSGTDWGFPEGVSSVNDIDPQELEPHYFTPNFLRPMPEAEEDPEIDSERTYDVSNDVCFTHIIFSFRLCI
jgi:hypothetical protein